MIAPGVFSGLKGRPEVSRRAQAPGRPRRRSRAQGRKKTRDDLIRSFAPSGLPDSFAYSFRTLTGPANLSAALRAAGVPTNRIIAEGAGQTDQKRNADARTAPCNSFNRKTVRLCDLRDLCGLCGSLALEVGTRRTTGREVQNPKRGNSEGKQPSTSTRTIVARQILHS